MSTTPRDEAGARIVAETERIAGLRKAGPLLSALLTLLAGMPLLATRIGAPEAVLDLVERAGRTADMTRDLEDAGWGALAEAAGDNYNTFTRLHDLGRPMMHMDEAGTRRALSLILGGLSHALMHPDALGTPEARSAVLAIVQRAAEPASQDGER